MKEWNRHCRERKQVGIEKVNERKRPLEGKRDGSLIDGGGGGVPLFVLWNGVPALFSITHSVNNF